jgi:hypothetical protein
LVTLATERETTGVAEQAAVRDQVCGCVLRRCRESFASHLRSLVLTGSMARNEATIRIGSNKPQAISHKHGAPKPAAENRELRTENSLKVLGDVDFILVFNDRHALPNSRFVAAVLAGCEADLRDAGIDAHLSMATVHGNYFQELPPHIFSYELRASGRVIWGDADILQLIPEFAPQALSLEDAWRMLSNRMTEWLKEAAGNSSDKQQATSNKQENAKPSTENSRTVGSGKQDGGADGLTYATIKLYLDMATSLLVFLQAYEPSYGARAKKLASLADAQGEAFNLPFPLRDFAQLVTACTEWKIGSKSSGASLEFSSRMAAGWQQAVDWARRLWVWELAQLTAVSSFAFPVSSAGAECADPLETGNGKLEPDTTESLFNSLAGTQTLSQKLRGWLYVVRREGWLRSAPHWPRWLRMMCRCTPRYGVYYATFQLISRLPAAGREDVREVMSISKRVNNLLPVCAGHPAVTGTNWQPLAAQIVWNYRNFVVETRA